MMSVPVAATAISLSFGSCLERLRAHRHLVDDGDVGVLQPLDDLVVRPGRLIFFIAVRKIRPAGPWRRPIPDRGTRSRAALNSCPLPHAARSNPSDTPQLLPTPRGHQAGPQS